MPDLAQLLAPAGVAAFGAIVYLIDHPVNAQNPEQRRASVALLVLAGSLLTMAAAICQAVGGSP